MRPRNVYLTAAALLAATLFLLYVIMPHFEGQTRDAIGWTALVLGTISGFLPFILLRGKVV